MIKLTEFYAERQGRPDSKVAMDMESRAPAIPAGYLSGIMLKASYSTIEQTKDYTAAGYTVILVDATSPVRITLPEAETNAGKYYYIKKIDSSNNKVIVEGDSTTETIDGEENIELTSQYQYVKVFCNSTVWYIIGGEYVGLESTMDDLLNKQISSLEELLIQIKLIKLHLATGLTGMDISGEDIEED